MNEYLFTAFLFWSSGGLIGGAIGYLFGRYRIKIRRVEEEDKSDLDKLERFKQRMDRPTFPRKVMD
jgi:membrane protein DedA with SNARE-associated domain